MIILDTAPLIRQRSVEQSFICNATSVQVAGTNGKGSTCAFLAAILQAHGKRVGLYSSPHLLDICERISIDGKNIEYNEFGKLVQKINEAEPGLCKSDLMCFAATEYFNVHNVDYAIFETGLGGTKDSATLLNHKYGIITQIGLDHTELLGDTIEAITMEKAGIIKSDMEIIAYPNATNYLIEEACTERSAVLHDMNLAEFEEQGFIYEGDEYASVQLAMDGHFQLFNCACAITCSKVMLGAEFNKETAICAVQQVCVPGRMSVLKKTPLVLADVSHNPDGIRALCTYIDSLVGKKCAVVAIPKTKDYNSMISLLRGSFDYIIAMIADDKSVVPEKLKADEIAKNLNQAKELAQGYDVTVFCGSFAMASMMINNKNNI